MPGNDDVYLVLGHQQLVRWDGKPVIPAFLTSSLKRPAVDTTLLDAAEEKWPPGDQPSRREIAAYNAAQHGLPPGQFTTLMKEFQQKRDQFDNYREQILWMTRRALELKAAATMPTTGPGSP